MNKKIIVFFVSLIISLSAISVTGETVSVTNPGKLRGASSDDIVLGLIQQLDEELYLEYLEGLVAFGPRVTGTQECDDAADYIYNEFVKMGLETRYQEWGEGDFKGKNIEATINGIDKSSNELFIICGHYDTVGESPGADDDGSGTVLALSAAKIMSNYSFDHTVKFVAFSGEEEGLCGSSYYVQEAVDNKCDIVAVLNADMIGFARTEEEARYVDIYEDEYSQWITDFTMNVSEKYNDLLNLEVVPSGYSGGSDHMSFWLAGYNAIFYAEENFNDYYHSPDDTIEHMNIPYAVRISQLIVATLAELSEVSLKDAPLQPSAPQGQTSGEIDVEYRYTTSTTDPQDDQIYYLFDWGDGTTSSWVGPFDSGSVCNTSHIWNKKGRYVIKVKAKDTNGYESGWSDSLRITMPYSYTPMQPFLERLFQRSPKAFPILQQQLGY